MITNEETLKDAVEIQPIKNSDYFSKIPKAAVPAIKRAIEQLNTELIKKCGSMGKSVVLGLWIFTAYYIGVIQIDILRSCK